MKKIRVVVVGVAAMQPGDPKLAPPGEDPVLAHAVKLAQHLGAVLHVVHVLESSGAELSSYTHAVHAYDSWPFQVGLREAVESGLWGQVRRFPSFRSIRCRVLEGSPHVRLCEYAEEVEADLVVVGATRRGWIWRNILGTTAGRVLGRSTLPVLVVRRPVMALPRRVLFATDLNSANTATYPEAMGTAQALAGPQGLESRLLLVCVKEPSSLLASPELITQSARERLDRFLEANRHQDQPVEGKVRIGNPSSEIIREAEEWKADLVVLGTGSRRNHLTALLGSTGAATLRGICCNVLVVPVRSVDEEQHEGRGRHRTVGEEWFQTEEQPAGIQAVSAGV